MGAEDLKWAVSQFASGTRVRQHLARKYYDGEHRLQYMTEKWRTTFGYLFKELAENMCPAVVDSLADRLLVTGFKSSAAETAKEKYPSPYPGMPEREVVVVDDPLGRVAWDIWRQNNMDLISGEVHEEACKVGDAYVIVWPGEDMTPQIFFNYGTDCAVQYDPNMQGRRIRGTKVWHDEVDKHWYLNVYLPDRIEKYRSRGAQGTSTYLPTGQSDYGLFQTVPNPYGVVPVFHFSFDELFRPGRSRLRDVIPLQDALNKAVMDMIITMEFASFKQRYIIGLEPETDETTGEPVDPMMRNYGVDRMMAIGNEDAKVGQFDATDLGQFLRVQEKFWASCARVSGTPLHYFYITTGDFPSGEAMKSAEARFVKDISDNQIGFGTVWEQVLLFSLRIQQTIPDDLRLDVLWKDASPRTESEIADTAVKKKAVGVSKSQILKELGYDDETIQRMMQETMAEDMLKMMAMQQERDQNLSNGGTPGSQERSTAQPTGENTRGVRS